MTSSSSPIKELLARQRFFSDFPPEFVAWVAGCARSVAFDAGEYLAREGDRADAFYLVMEGSVALEIAVPGRPPITIATLAKHDLVGVSWLVPPHVWMFDARAIEPVTAIGFDAMCLRGKCETDHDLGYEMMKRFLPMLTQRLHATRLQIVDVYGVC